jgi:hypothetical protein
MGALLLLIRSAAPTADLASALRVAASALNNNTRCILPPRPGGECVWESMKAKVRLLSPAHPPPSPVVSSLPYPRLSLITFPVSPSLLVSILCATVPWAELHAVDVQPDQRLGVRQWPKNGRQDGPRLVHVPCHDRQVGPAAIFPRGHCHRCPPCHSFVNCPCCSLSLTTQHAEPGLHLDRFPRRGQRHGSHLAGRLPTRPAPGTCSPVHHGPALDPPR